MLKSYFRIVFRTLFRTKLYTLINVLGLTLGMTTSLLIFMYVANERSYDQFHVNKNCIYRVRHDRSTNGELNRQWVAGPAGIGPDLKSAFPEVTRYVRMNKQISTFSNGNIFYKEDRVFNASEDFFEMFSFPLVTGNYSDVLRGPFKMVISESMAHRYFGTADPVGKFLRNNGKYDYEITGVFKDVPENSHMKFDALLSFSSFIQIIGPEEEKDFQSWQWDGYYTYIQIDPASNWQALQVKIASFVEKRMGSKLREWNEGMAFVLQPLPDIHLSSNFTDEIEPNGNGETINQLTIVASFILLIAWINYINLATAKSLERAREVGLRKIMGSKKAQLIVQFLIESAIVNLVAAIVTMVLVLLLLPSFSTFVERQFDLAVFRTGKLWLSAVGVFIIGSLGAGLYPAFALAGFKPISMVAGKLRSSASGIYLRKGLVIMQFASAIILIFSAVTIYQQIDFLKNTSLGFDTEQVLVLNGPTITDATFPTKFKTFKEEVIRRDGILQVTGTSTVPGRPGMGRGGIKLDNRSDNSSNAFRMIVSDEGYQDVFGMKIVAGRYFSKEFNDTNSLVINETAMHLLGIQKAEQAIGQRINVGETIIGVLKDYHHESVKKRVDQLIYVYDPAWTEFIAIKIKPNRHLEQTMNDLESLFTSTFPGNPYNFFFLDEFYDRQYHADQQFSKLITFFTIVGIIISCLGLFGLSSYTIVQRTKEIGIRKTLGASVPQILVLVSREFILLVIIANLIALPVSYYLLSGWLNGFANRINLGMISFLLPTAVTLLIAMLTISSQSIKAARTNPINSLRSE